MNNRISALIIFILLLGTIFVPSFQSYAVDTTGEYCVITLPQDGSAFTGRLVTYYASYRVKQTNVNNIGISVKNNLGNALSSDSNIFSYTLNSNTGSVVGDYYEGTISFTVNYKTSLIGNYTIYVYVTGGTSTVTGSKTVNLTTYSSDNSSGGVVDSTKAFTFKYVSNNTFPFALNSVNL